MHQLPEEKSSRDSSSLQGPGPILIRVLHGDPWALVSLISKHNQMLLYASHAMHQTPCDYTEEQKVVSGCCYGDLRTIRIAVAS